MPQVGNKKFPYTAKGIKEAKTAKSEMQDLLKKKSGTLVEQPLYDGTPAQVDKIGKAPHPTGKPSLAKPMIATPMNEEETMFYQQRLNDLGFDLKVDGIYGARTAEADSMFNAYSLKNFDDEYIKNINTAKSMGYPAHLLEDNNEALYNKWKKGTFNMTDEEYKQVYPDAKDNAEILSEVQNRLFDAIKKVK